MKTAFVPDSASEDLVELCAREAWAALLAFDQAGNCQTSRVEWDKESSVRRERTLALVRLIIAGTSLGELLERSGETVGGNAIPYARGLIMMSVVSSAAKRETASDVANRALRERDAMRRESLTALELLGKGDRHAGLPAAPFNDLVRIVQNLAWLAQ